MKTPFFLLIFLLWSMSSYGQSNFSISTKTGYAFNSSLKLNGEPINQLKGIILELGGAYEIGLYKYLFAEVGLAGRTIFSSGKIKQISFNATTTRLRSSLKLGLILSNKWTLSSGFGIQNNKDFAAIDLREKHFWRCNFMVDAKYKWRERWFLIGEINYEVRDLPEAYFLNDPKCAVLIGIARKI